MEEKNVRTVEVFVNLPVKSIAQAFTYRVPDALASVGVGWRVFVPFGGRKVEGFVVAVAEKSEQELDALGFAVKDILATVDEEAWFTPVLLKAAAWLADFYLCSLAEIMRLFMPGKSGLKITVEYAADETKDDHVLLGMASYRRLYEAIAENGPMRRGALRKALPDLADELPAMLEKLASYHIVTKEYAAEKRDAALYERYVVLKEPLTDEQEKAFVRRRAQLALWRYLTAHNGTASLKELESEGIHADAAKKLAASGIVALRRRRVLRDSYAGATASHEPRTLTDEQQTAVTAVQPAIAARKYHGFLLYGVTGSGKTQVYIELARLVRQRGRKVIVLVPEIALTGQLVRAFQSYFVGDIIVMHSRLTLAERNDAVLRVRRGEAGIIIGARSALFTPADDVGLIILDEEQDMSYKQDESPRYHARVVAEELAHLHGAVLLLGSATPSLETYHRAKMGELTLLRMQHRVGDIPLPDVSCVDMRQELRMGNRHIISRPLEALIRKTIAAHEQLIIMLNRRGYSTFVMCRSCGEVIKCPDCGMPLVYHETRRGKVLLCHHCDIRKPVPDVCPKCGSRYIKYFGSGTEKLEQELRTLVPEARVCRMDRDTTGGKFAHQEILGRFHRGAFDILLGTQMVAKGHDIPNVTAVGIISADASLNMPDFRAAERCFMLITQTAGRAGRHTAVGARGHVLVQTYNTEHYAVQCGIHQDYERFYQKEIALRKALGYPPFTRLVKLLFQNEKEATAKQAAVAFVQAFQQRFPMGAYDPLGKAPTTNTVIGPAPALIACFRGTYRFVVLIKAIDLASVQAFLREQGLHLRTDVAIDIDPITIM